MAKNIVVCCDGTGNGPVQPNRATNVLKLFSALIVDRQCQVACYYPGVGTRGSPTALTGLVQMWTRLLGLAAGYGFTQSVTDCYQFLMNTYEDGDHIFLFGFSRGAYVVKTLANIVVGYGLLHDGQQVLTPYLVDEFVRGRGSLREGGYLASRPLNPAFVRPCKPLLYRCVGYGRLTR